ncbi:MAG TPA: S46 family peptidase [Caulobacteraceae bacterium]|nr:S46 family peptidase [Caulobacteraceae bacterium]
MKFLPVAALAACVAALSVPAQADEGMWTFDNVPTADIKAALGVDITPAWLARVQGATVRLSVGCSGSVVSGQGLVLTNNHCAEDCAHDLSTPGHDLADDGAFAATTAEEKACPTLRAEILESARDVTPRVLAAGAGLTGEALVKAVNAVSSTIAEDACRGEPTHHCQVVDLYHGGQYKLYRYREYGDVRLVFSAGDRVGSFGGDPDNFNFPRYDLDVAFLRLYENGRPVATPQHLRWDPAPPTAGQAVFVAGNPGATFRELTTAQLETQRSVIAPIEIAQLAELRGRLVRLSEESPEAKRLADDLLFDLENDYKVEWGRLLALDDPAFMAARRAAEADLRAKALKTMSLGFGDPWADIAKLQEAAAALYPAQRTLEGGPNDSRLFDYARWLVRAAAERAKPSPDRLPGYDDSRLPFVEREVLAPVPVDAVTEQLTLEFWLAKARELLGADDPDVVLLLGGESPETLSKALVARTHLGDPAVRKALWDGGWTAIQASDDPMIRYALKIDPEARRIRAEYEERVIGPTDRAAEAIARARFAVYGASVYPDATFTLRLSYGAVQGWTWRGVTTAPFTTFSGLYRRGTGEPPYDLDPRWIAAKERLDPDTIFNFTTTNDIVGGNSGSPIMDAKGDVIGTAFDGNILSIGGDYGYDGAVNRSVAVSAAAITEALTKVYGADALVRELDGR